MRYTGIVKRGRYMIDKILIVDDSEINRELLKEILSDHYEIVEAYDGWHLISSTGKARIYPRSF